MTRLISDPFSKVLEKILFDQLNQYFENNNLFSNSQFGFRKNRGTVDAVLEFTDFIHTCFEEGKIGVASFLDLSKAFDCVNHEILIKKIAVLQTTL